MRRLIILGFIILLAGCSMLEGLNQPGSPLEVSGVLQGKTRLQGRVIMVGDLLVPVGSQLIIAPGTTVVIRKSESTKIDPEYLSAETELLIRGSLVVDGRPEAKVTFVPETPVGAGEVAWAGILLDGATGSSIRNAIIVQPETGILIVNTSSDIIDNQINRARYGIVVQGGASKILDNEVSFGEGGIFCWNGARPYLKGNLVIANDEEGIVVDRSSRPYLDRNKVSGNNIGLVVPAKLPYDSTFIAGNGIDVKLLSDRGEGSR